MAKLTAEEQAQLDKLNARLEEPDEPTTGRQENVSIHIDLSDPEAVDRAVELGYLTRKEAEELTDEEEGEGEGKGKKTDGAPARSGRRKILSAGYGDE